MFYSFDMFYTFYMFNTLADVVHVVVNIVDVLLMYKMGNGQSFRCLHVVVFDEQVVHITDSVAQVGRRPHGGGTYLAAWESHHHLDTVP